MIQNIIDKLHEFVTNYDIESLFIAGEYCRRLYLDNTEHTKHIDVVSAFHNQADHLGVLFATEIMHMAPIIKNGTVSIVIESDIPVCIEFQCSSTKSYMHNAEIKEWMRINKVDDVPINNNLYGRDFTIDTLFYSLANRKLYDPTNRAIQDFESQMIVSVLPSELAVKFNPVIVLRAISCALEYDFHIDTALRIDMQNNIERILNVIPENKLKSEIVKILHLDHAKGIELIKQYHLSRFLDNQDN